MRASLVAGVRSFEPGPKRIPQLFDNHTPVSELHQGLAQVSDLAEKSCQAGLSQIFNIVLYTRFCHLVH